MSSESRMDELLMSVNMANAKDKTEVEMLMGEELFSEADNTVEEEENMISTETIEKPVPEAAPELNVLYEKLDVLTKKLEDSEKILLEIKQDKQIKQIVLTIALSVLGTLGFIFIAL